MKTEDCKQLWNITLDDLMNRLGVKWARPLSQMDRIAVQWLPGLFMYIHSRVFRIQPTHAIPVICKPSIWFETIIWLLIICISNNYRKTRWPDGFQESAICTTFTHVCQRKSIPPTCIIIANPQVGWLLFQYSDYGIWYFSRMKFSYGKVDSLQKIRRMLRQFLNKI